MGHLTNEGQGTTWHSLMKHVYKERLLPKYLDDQSSSFNFKLK